MFKRNKYSKPDKLLFNYYEGQAGLPMEPGYEEITLTSTENPKKLQMDVYFRPPGDNETESKTTYLVSAKALYDVMKLVHKHKMIKWNKSDYPCLCGKIYVCKFWWKKEFIRVSSDSIPDNGSEVFDEISAVLYGYADSALNF